MFVIFIGTIRLLCLICILFVFRVVRVHLIGSREDILITYVSFQIVETMSYNAKVETFLGSLGNFYDTVPAEDLEMLLGPVIERVRSQPGSPLKGSPLGKILLPYRKRN